IGTSFTSLDEARGNLAAEIPGYDFDATAAAAQATWDKALGRIQIAPASTFSIKAQATPSASGDHSSIQPQLTPSPSGDNSVSQPSPAAARRMFYTALYHAMMLPRIASDVSGRYPRFASDYQTEVAHGFTYYDDFSLWDTFRAVHPLFVLLEPHRDGETMQSLVAKGTAA